MDLPLGVPRDGIDHLVPTPVGGGLTFRAVSAGLFHACGVTTSDAAYCWGWNYLGRLGIGLFGGSNYSFPIQVVAP